MGVSFTCEGELGETSSDAPSCEIWERRSLEVLKSWQVGSVVWSDRAWTYTRLGSFTTAAFQFKVLAEVDRRKATFRIAAPSAHGITVYVLGETKAVDAPWAFSAGAPDLSEEWSNSELCETFPEYEAGATYRFDFGRCRSLRPSETVSFNAFSGGKVDIFVKVVDGPRDWRDTDIAEASEVLPSLRTAPGGRRPGRCEDHEAVPMPPENGWEVSPSGWETHVGSPIWKRRRAENGSSLFFCVPLKSRWATLPGKGFVPVDSCLSLLNCMRDVETTWRQCFQSWKEHSRTVTAWRQRLQLLETDKEEVSERVSEHFELRTAFRRKSSLKRENSEEGCDGRSERTPKKVSFASTDGEQPS